MRGDMTDPARGEAPMRPAGERGDGWDFFRGVFFWLPESATTMRGLTPGESTWRRGLRAASGEKGGEQRRRDEGKGARHRQER